MPVSSVIKRAVWVRDGGCCAVCRDRVFLAAAEGTAAKFRGEVAHIVAGQRDGPRGDSPLTPQERNHENNLLLLCFDHHADIDNNADQFSVDSLHDIKAKHSSWVAECLKLEAAWQTKLHNFYYLNVPRLLVLSAMSGVTLDLSRYGEYVALHELGWELGGLMVGFKRLLERVELKAVLLESALTLGPDARGLIVSFNGPFRTRNIRMPQTPDEYRSAIRGNLKTDPHIYATVKGTKVSQIIDPRWITTTTAFVQFRPTGGQGTFAGLGLLNSVTTGNASVTPLVIGLPSNPFIEAFYGGA